MKRTHLISSSLAVIFLASATMLAIAYDDTNTKRKSPATKRDKIGKLDEKTAGANVRTTELLGRNIYNPQGKSVGEISDLVIDANHGNIRYAAVTYGGILGIGNKMFAVPYDAFTCRQDSDDANEYVLVLDVTQEQLEGDRGFDEDHWPNFADQKFTRTVDRRYKVKHRKAHRETAANSARERTGAIDKKTAGANIRASQLHGLNIQNPEGKSVGEIQDLVINANNGDVQYAAVTYGGFLGLGDKMFAVPFEAFKCQPNPDDKNEHIAVLNVTQEQLEGARGFDQEHWPNFADRSYTNELYKRYKVKHDRDADIEVEIDKR
ncbi:PRC-barrel domain protein [Symmachiella dynata]|uniref:PRC-barrel domain protein n=1 Tax=Symmachiella dynata TaxID=2527995 RepID=A0A517ZUK8_9PLAN|nr:PRC-barrel domain-containing protein [Symmachiella dynata]QDU46159.1 PRC-barrel domain protein [Symmachiella dynata]